jgi:hypothetical protein
MLNPDGFEEVLKSFYGTAAVHVPLCEYSFSPAVRLPPSISATMHRDRMILL